ncbi:MAG: DUF4317 domain-containing protein [Lachnospiraceae bacterium]|nr:DUF4317 domain-containing protein [Lachnospiraceae bacterium]
MTAVNREDMLELTRRMTPKRNCFSRIAGAYFDEEGFVDGTFNRHFLKLSAKDIETNLRLAKTVPFSETNKNLIYHPFSRDDEKAGHTWQILMGLKDCELKNDALLELFYEFIGEKYITDKPFAVRILYGSYDIPIKAKDKESLWESEEVYKFIICTFCSLLDDYEAGPPDCGFLFPAFIDRSADIHGVMVYQADEKHPHEELVRDILLSASR